MPRRLWANMMLSTKHNVLHYPQTRTKPRPQATCAENFAKFEQVLSKICEKTDIQTRLSQYFAPLAGVKQQYWLVWCCDGRLLLMLVKNGSRADTTGLVISRLSAGLHHTMQTSTLPQRILQNDNNTVTLSFYLNHCLPTFYNQSKAPLSKRIQQAANFSYSNIYTLQKRPFIFQVSLFNC